MPGASAEEKLTWTANLRLGGRTWPKAEFNWDAGYMRRANIMRLSIYAALVYEFSHPVTRSQVKRLVLTELRALHPTAFNSPATTDSEHFDHAWIRLMLNGFVVA